MNNKYLKKNYLIATSLSFLLVAGVCLGADVGTGNDAIEVWKGTPEEIIKNIQEQLLLILGAICILMIIIGGALYMTAKDDPKQAESGKTTVKVALIGLVIVLASAMLMEFVKSLGSGAGGGGTN